MRTLQLSDSQARHLYPSASPDIKAILENTFSKEFFSAKITDRVKTFEDACGELGIQPSDVLHAAHSDFLKKDIDSINAYCKLIVIARALNEGWEPDWDNGNEYKHYPWFYMDSESGCSLGDVCRGRGNSIVGSRLCFKSADLAEYAATQFLDIYKTFFTL